MNQTLQNALIRLLRPLVRMLLRNGVPYGAFAELAKAVYVDVALAEFGIPDRKPSISRASILTGLTRKEVSRMKTLPPGRDTEAVARYHRAARVINAWVRDPRYQTAEGAPAALRPAGHGATFTDLVRRASGDMPARAVQDELLRVGAIERLGDGRLRLVARAYVPRTGEADKLTILGVDAAHLIATIDHNIVHGATDPYFQRKVAYDNLPEQIIPEWRRLTATKAQALLEEMDRWLAQHDRDRNPRVTGSGRREAGIGIYYFERDVQPGGSSHGHP